MGCISRKPWQLLRDIRNNMAIHSHRTCSPSQRLNFALKLMDHRRVSFADIRTIVEYTVTEQNKMRNHRWHTDHARVSELWEDKYPSRSDDSLSCHVRVYQWLKDDYDCWCRVPDLLVLFGFRSVDLFLVRKRKNNLEYKKKRRDSSGFSCLCKIS